MIEVISPPGFERFFRELAGLNESEPPESSQMAELTQCYQLSFAEPEWLPDVIARYGLTPPPNA